MQKLCKEFPHAEHAELLRFCRARPQSFDDAKDMYKKHLQWRRSEGSAMNLANAASAVSPRFIQHRGVACDGSLVFYLCGGAYSSEIGPELHVLALAHVLDQAFKSSDGTKGTVCIDTRPKKDLFNVPAHRMVPLFRMSGAVLQANYPERLQVLLVYPVPRVAAGLWWVAKGFCDAKTAAKVQLFSGDSGLGSPCPVQVGEYVELHQLPEDHWGANEQHGTEVETDGKPGDSIKLLEKE